LKKLRQGRTETMPCFYHGTKRKLTFITSYTRGMKARKGIGMQDSGRKGDGVVMVL
jgi:cation transport regulator ChaC